MCPCGKPNLSCFAEAEFTISLEAITRAREIVKGEFSFDTEGVSKVAEDERACIRAFNTYWDIKAHPLGTQIRYLLIGLFKASKYSPDELTNEPGLSICE